MKDKERLENCSRWKETEETGHQIERITLDWILDQKKKRERDVFIFILFYLYLFLFFYKEHYWVNWQSTKHTHNSLTYTRVPTHTHHISTVENQI